MYYKIAILLAFCVCSACNSKKIELEQKIQYFNPEEEYQNAILQLNKKQYSDAADNFENVFLYSSDNTLALNAQIMQAYSLVLNKKFEEAEDVLDNCILVDPNSQYLDYIYYLQGIALHSLVKTSLYDVSFATRAKQKFQYVINNFPSSVYYKSANIRITLINELLVEKEILIGMYYLQNLNAAAALKRFKNACKNYPHTSRHQETIYRIIESLLSLGLKTEAQKYFVQLQTEYPNGYWSNFATDHLQNLMY